MTLLQISYLNIIFGAISQMLVMLSSIKIFLLTLDKRMFFN